MTMKRMYAILIFISLFTICKAPEFRCGFIATNEPIKPYERLINAIGIVESGNDDNAVNRTENAWGRYQIRQIRLNDYYNRTGIRYKLTDMRDSVKSREVLIYYCKRFGVYQQDKLILDWNCQSRKYLRKVRSQMI